jgi:caa(3)-type oxidase subunit IV
MDDANALPLRTHEPDEPHGHSEPMPHHKVNYLAIFGLLVALTVVTVVVAFVHIQSEIVKVLIALTIASIKASFVALYFMHLKFEGKLIYLILLLPVFLCVVLVIALIPDVVHAHLFVDFTGRGGAGAMSPGAHP